MKRFKTTRKSAWKFWKVSRETTGPDKWASDCHLQSDAQVNQHGVLAAKPELAVVGPVVDAHKGLEADVGEQG